MHIWFLRRRTSSRATEHNRPRPPEQRLIFQSEGDWWDWLVKAIARLPWFGEQVPMSVPRHRRRGHALSHQEQQHVFLSWLAGGSAQDVAERAGVGRRTVYRVLSRVIYTDDPEAMMGWWGVLGLIVGLATPLCLENRDHVFDDVVCLICHEWIGTFKLSSRPLQPGTTFQPDPMTLTGGVMDRWDEACVAQAHLVEHFRLQEDPLQQPGRFGWLMRAFLNEDSLSRLPADTASNVPVESTKRWEDLHGASQGSQEWRRRLFEQGSQ